MPFGGGTLQAADSCTREGQFTLGKWMHCFTAKLRKSRSFLEFAPTALERLGKDILFFFISLCPTSISPACRQVTSTSEIPANWNAKILGPGDPGNVDSGQAIAEFIRTNKNRNLLKFPLSFPIPTDLPPSQHEHGSTVAGTRCVNLHDPSLESLGLLDSLYRPFSGDSCSPLPPPPPPPTNFVLQLYCLLPHLHPRVSSQSHISKARRF